MSSRKKSRLALLSVLLLVAAATATTATTAVAADEPSIVEAYPDTYEPRNAGEYVAVEFDGVDTTGWTLEDRFRETPLPNRTLDGTVYFARDGAPDDRHDYEKSLRLAADGDIVTLRDATNGTVDEIRYGDFGEVEASEGEILVRSGDAPTALETRPFGGTDLGVLRANASSVTAFVLPDSPEPVADSFRDADRRVKVSAFTFGSDHLADALSASEADVSVLAESVPPGGFERSTEAVFDRIDADADVYVADGDDRRYRFLHAKYAVADDSAVVTSENWEDRSFAPDAAGSRGWGVQVESDDAADYLAEVFEADRDWRAVSTWENASVESHEQDESDAEVRTDFGPRTADNAEVELFVTPDAPVEPVVSFVETADDEVLVQQSYIRAWNADLETNPYVAALRDRAEAGVDVRVLLDGRWYYEDENAEVAEALVEMGIDARVASRPVHTKGVVVDNESALVSSINWNENSPTNNREVGVIVHDSEVASYFAEVFESDWDADTDEEAGEGDVSPDAPAPTDYLLEAVIIIVVSGIAVWLVAREI